MRIHILAAMPLVMGASAVFADTFERDRDAILSMAGEYQVTFSFEETLRLVEDANHSEPYTSEAMETVKVIEDTGDFISLQHLLVVGSEEKPHVVKHWRQDWRYEPETMQVFRGNNTWEEVKVPRGEREGAWSQTVYQVADSPRYSSVAKWVHLADHSYWEPQETWRPLPRREIEKRDDYDVVVGRNRHSITPDGWLHEQDNYKLALRPEGNVILARERGFNTYDTETEFDFAAAYEYWDATEAFWAQVRAEWQERFDASPTLRLAAEQDGDALFERIMGLARRYGSGKYESDDAARADIAEQLDLFTLTDQVSAK